MMLQLLRAGSECAVALLHAACIICRLDVMYLKCWFEKVTWAAHTAAGALLSLAWWPSAVQPASCKNLGICVVLPQPVSPTTTTVAWFSTRYSSSRRTCSAGSWSVRARLFLCCC